MQLNAQGEAFTGWGVASTEPGIFGNLNGMDTDAKDDTVDAQSGASATGGTPPPTAPPPPDFQEGNRDRGPNSSFRFFTDKVAGPNVRLFDNLFSLGSAITGIIAGLLVMHFILIPTYDLASKLIPLFWMILAGVGGLIGGVLIGGLILMVIGLFRKD